jgi:hypothetical protein
MPKPTGEVGFLKQNIITIISQDVDTVQEVVDYEKVGFRGFPAVTVTCSGNENSFYSSAENERVFLFALRIYEQLENVPKLDSSGADNEKQRAEQIVERVVDQILNAFDTTTSFTMDGSADNGVEAVPSRWGYAQLPAGWCRVAEIDLRIKRTKIVA